jgi:phosphate transport system protein
MQTAIQHRAHYDRQLQALREGILMLGSMAEKAVSRSVEALRLRDVNLARSVIEDDRKIDDYSYALEEQALLLTATQQPLATDLRTIAAPKGSRRSPYRWPRTRR